MVIVIVAGFILIGYLATLACAHAQDMANIEASNKDEKEYE